MAKWAHDGTQDPGPPPLMADALTGGGYDPEPVRVRVVEPPMPDISAVRAAMASVLDEDSELMLAVAQTEQRLDRSGPPTSELPVQTAPVAAATGAAPPVSVVPPPPAPPIPAAPPAAPPPPLAPAAPPPLPARSRAAGAFARFGGGLPARLPGRDPMRRLRERRVRMVRRGSGFSPGMAAVVLLLLVIAVLVVVMLASLVNTISSIFS